MVPRQASMLIESAAATSRLPYRAALCVLTIACGVVSTACASRSKLAHDRHQSSDLVLSPRAATTQRGWVGIQLTASERREARVAVVAVVPDSPAQAAGIRAGDQVLECDEQRLERPEDLVTRIRSSQPGTVLRLKVVRGGTAISLGVKVAASPDENSVLTRLFVGREAPPLDGLVAIGDQPIPNPFDLRGRVVVLDFWAPWCGVCHLVADELNLWQRQFGEQLQVIGIAVGGPQDVSRFAPRFHMEYLVAADPREVISRAFNATAVPMVFVIDRSGVVRAVHLGYSSERMSTMKQLVTQLVSHNEVKRSQ